jgi:hypothetical protein
MRAGLRRPCNESELMPNQLFIANLPLYITDAGLSEIVSLASLKVTYAMTIPSKTSSSPKGFGLVQLALGENVQRAIRILNEVSFEGQTLTVYELHGGESRMLLKERLPAQTGPHRRKPEHSLARG